MVADFQKEFWFHVAFLLIVCAITTSDKFILSTLLSVLIVLIRSFAACCISEQIVKNMAKFFRLTPFYPAGSGCGQKGHLLVMAGAVRDTSRTLTNRLVRPVEDGTFAAPILLLAFTRKAARQILLRVAELLLLNRRS